MNLVFDDIDGLLYILHVKPRQLQNLLHVIVFVDEISKNFVRVGYFQAVPFLLTERFFSSRFAVVFDDFNCLLDFVHPSRLNSYFLI